MALNLNAPGQYTVSVFMEQFKDINVVFVDEKGPCPRAAVDGFSLVLITA